MASGIMEVTPHESSSSSSSSSSAAGGSSSSMVVEDELPPLDCSVCNGLSFKDVCSLFKQIQNTPKKEDKLGLIFHRKLREEVGPDGSIYPLLRLILPQIDMDRKSYGMKEANIAKLYVERLNLPSGNKEDPGYKLLHWKKGDNGDSKTSGYPSQKMKSAEFSTILETIIQDRMYKTPRKWLTLGEVNAILDRMVSKGGDKQETYDFIYEEVLDSMSAEEQKWFWRIVLKDLKFQLKHESVLGSFFPKAMDVFNATSDLRYICTKRFTKDELEGKGGSIYEIDAIHRLSPMLAKGFMNAGEEQAKQCEKAMAGDYFTMDMKLDGERMLFHLKDGQAKFFTRNGNDYSVMYERLLTDMKDSLMANNVRECIIDGEVLAVRKELKCKERKSSYVAVDFGRNKTVAGEESRLFNNDGKEWEELDSWLQFSAFDIIYIKDDRVEGIIATQRANLGNKLVVNRQDPNSTLKASGDITKLPLLLRRAILDAIMPKIPEERFNIVEHQVCFSNDYNERIKMITKVFEDAYQGGEEGIVVKQLNSMYYCGDASRDYRKWVKMKPAYEGITDTLDLCIIGGYRGQGQGFRREGMSKFLLASLDKDGNIRTVTKVGTGYTFEALKEIRDKLNPLMKDFDKKKPPNYLKHWNILKPDEVPDFYIPEEKLEESIVFELRCDEVIQTESMSANVCVRFPRVLRIRNDKSIRDCTRIEEIQGLVGIAPSKKFVAKDGEGEGEGGGGGDENGDNAEGFGDSSALDSGSRKKRKVMKGKEIKESKVAKAFQHKTDDDDAALRNYIFDNITFCVMGINGQYVDTDWNNTVYTRALLLDLIHKQNGKTIENPTNECIVIALPPPAENAGAGAGVGGAGGGGSKVDWDVKITNLITAGEHDIYLANYIIDSIKLEELIAPSSSSEYFLFCKEDTRKLFREDMFGVRMASVNTDASIRSVFRNFDVSLAATKGNPLRIRNKINSKLMKGEKEELTGRVEEAKKLVADIDAIGKKSWRNLAVDLLTSEKTDVVTQCSSGMIYNLFWDPETTYFISGSSGKQSAAIAAETVLSLGGRLVVRKDISDSTVVVMMAEGESELANSASAIEKYQELRNRAKFIVRESFIHDSVRQRTVVQDLKNYLI